MSCFNSVLILSAHLRLLLSNDRFTLSFTTQISHFLMRDTCPFHVIVLGLVTVILFAEK